MSIFFNDAVAGTVVQVKATNGQIKAINLVNTTGNVAYLQVFDKPSASVTLGTTVPVFAARMTAGGPYEWSPPCGLDLAGTGISVAGTDTAIGSTGAAISVTMLYQ